MARILVIDDEDQIRRLLRRALEGKGHEVLEASNGKEGLRLHRQSPADLVITDIHMPEEDGIEVIMTLHREAPRLKVIAISGGGRYLESTALDVAEPLGAFATFRKPFELGAILATIDRALAA